MSDSTLDFFGYSRRLFWGPPSVPRSFQVTGLSFLIKWWKSHRLSCRISRKREHVHVKMYKCLYTHTLAQLHVRMHMRMSMTLYTLLCMCLAVVYYIYIYISTKSCVFVCRCTYMHQCSSTRTCLRLRFIRFFCTYITDVLCARAKTNIVYLGRLQCHMRCDMLLSSKLQVVVHRRNVNM